MQNEIISFDSAPREMKSTVIAVVTFFPSCSQCVLVTDYLIGTVHQAKGLEFDTVLIADDFVQVPHLSGNHQRTNFNIGKDVFGTHPDLKIWKDLEAKHAAGACHVSLCFSALSSATGCPGDY